MFYVRIPQIYTSTIESDNGLSGNHLFLNATDFYDRQIFPKYPAPLVNCAPNALSCAAPAELASHMETDVSSFAHNFQTPKVEQASLTMERELAERLAVGISYMYVHGEHLIRARDANLPEPTQVTYPVYDSTGENFLGTYYNLASFSTWQMTRSLTCPYPPCINPLARPIPELGAVNVFDSAASSVYQGVTLSIRRRMTSGLYFRLAYTYAKAIDDGQDALVAGRPSTVQNSFAPSERGPSVTDQRHRVAFSWIAEPRPFDRAHPGLGRFFNDWKLAGVVTYGSGRPIDARVIGDANQDGNSFNDRLPGFRRNSFVGPNYATTDLRVTRRFFVRDKIKLDFIVESFNLLNRDNQRVQITEDGFQNTASQFAQVDNSIGVNIFPAQYRNPTNFLRASDAYAPRQLQVALKLTY